MHGRTVWRSGHRERFMAVGVGEIGGPSGNVTIRDVAKAAGVSVGTASRVLNGRTNVDPALKKAVEDAVASLGYHPSILAQNMKSGATRTIGILLTDITVPSLAALTSTAQDVLNKAGYSVIIGLHQYTVEREAELLRFLPGRVDGLIMSTCSEVDEQLVKMRSSLRIPLVLRDRDVPSTASSVRILHRTATKRATEYLIELGHRRIALITGKPPLYPARSRIEGYEEALREHGLPIEPSIMGTSAYAPAGNFTDLSTILASPNRPTALILGGASMLPAALETIRNIGLRIPQDISIIGSSDNDLARLATPPITVLRWSDREMGRLCAGLMLAQLASKDTIPRQLFLEAELVIRDSCASPNRPKK